MADDQDQSQKTEEPTQKRLQDALKKGQVAKSRELTNFLMMGILALNLAIILPYVLSLTTDTYAVFIQSPHDYSVDSGNLFQIFKEAFWKGVGIMALVVSGVIIAALVGNLSQHELVLSTDPIKPKWEKISVFKGIKRLFSLKSMIEFLKGIFKITFIGAIAFYAAWPSIGRLYQLPGYENIETLRMIDTVAVRMLIGVCAAMFFIAVIDFLYQRFEHIKNMRMSRKEIKDEYKEQEGDPQIKAKIRAIRMERARNRMMASVPEADVVITNPTHFAIALKYETGTMQAPILVAKGADFIAKKIREIATEHKIPLVENKTLARALFDNVELDEEIPTEYYQAVAEVISYVYRLKGKL